MIAWRQLEELQQGDKPAAYEHRMANKGYHLVTDGTFKLLYTMIHKTQDKYQLGK